MREHHNAPTGEETGSSGPPPPPPPSAMARRITRDLRHDLLELETIVSSLTNKLARTRSELASIEVALEHAPTSVLSDLMAIRTGAEDVDLF